MTKDEALKLAQEPVAWLQVYLCKIKSKAQINKEIPREKQGWWADVAPSSLIRLRQATQADIDRCTLNDAHSKDPAEYMCETFKNGALVSKIALEWMNPEQNVFAPVGATPPAQPALVMQQAYRTSDAYSVGFKDGQEAQPAVPLTAQERKAIYDECQGIDVMKAIIQTESKLKEKNT